MNGELEQVRQLRVTLWEAGGYRPVPIYSPGARTRKGIPIKNAGKRPVTNDWPALARCNPPDAVTRAVSPLAMNTGLLCGLLIGIDIDVLIAALVERITQLIESILDPTPLHRIGRAPKLLLCYRSDELFSKLATPIYIMSGGSEAHVEILADGQQFVAFGTHPDTMQPYSWLDRSPLDVALADLPVLPATLAHDLIGEIEIMLRDAGGVAKTPEPTKEPPPQRPKKTSQRSGEDFFRNVNNAALADLASWVPAMLPKARFYTGKQTWRITSQALGRNFEEDLSFSPDGIRDFGDDNGDPNGRPLTAIDAVQEFGSAADVTAAAMWLCDHLGLSPQSLGWHLPRKRANGHDKPGGGAEAKQLPPPGSEPGQGEGEGGRQALPPPEPDDDPAPKLRRGVSLNDFFAVMTEHKYVYMPNRTLWPVDSINGRFGKIQVRLATGRLVQVKAANWLDMHRPVEQLTWAPGKPMVIDGWLINEGGWIEREGTRSFNLYLPPTLKHGDPKAVQPWLDHFRLIYPDDVEHIVCYLAHRVQHPEDKINHAIVLSGEPGIGKDTLLEPVKRTPVEFQRGLADASDGPVQRVFEGGHPAHQRDQGSRRDRPLQILRAHEDHHRGTARCADVRREKYSRARHPQCLRRGLHHQPQNPGDVPAGQ